MKRVFFASILCLTLSIVSAQIVVPNGDFESWVATPQFSLDPEYWQTDNGQLILSTYQDSVPYEGMWGMKVTPVLVGVGEEGYARVEIPTTVIPPALDFHVKYERTATCGLGVSVTFYNGDDYVYGNNWFADDLESDWTPISIELSQIEPIMTHVIIEVWVVIGDFAPGEGWISVDAMSFASPNGIDDLSTASLGLHPNPASDILVIDAADSRTNYAIYDAMGKLLIRDTYQDGVDVSALPAGKYFIKVNNPDGIIRSNVFMVE